MPHPLPMVQSNVVDEVPVASLTLNAPTQMLKCLNRQIVPYLIVGFICTKSTAGSPLAPLVEAGEPFSCTSVREPPDPTPPEAPVLRLPGRQDLKAYDPLSAGVDWWRTAWRLRTGSGTCAINFACPCRVVSW